MQHEYMHKKALRETNKCQRTCLWNAAHISTDNQLLNKRSAMLLKRFQKKKKKKSVTKQRTVNVFKWKKVKKKRKKPDHKSQKNLP